MNNALTLLCWHSTGMHVLHENPTSSWAKPVQGTSKLSSHPLTGLGHQPQPWQSEHPWLCGQRLAWDWLCRRLQDNATHVVCMRGEMLMLVKHSSMLAGIVGTCKTASSLHVMGDQAVLLARHSSICKGRTKFGHTEACFTIISNYTCKYCKSLWWAETLCTGEWTNIRDVQIRVHVSSAVLHLHSPAGCLFAMQFLFRLMGTAWLEMIGLIVGLAASAAALILAPGMKR